MDEDYISTEYLIMHEDEINWNELSKNPNRPLSLVEARLFRKNIDWKKYIITHAGTLTNDFLEVRK